jgi:hypothetical protein
MVGVVQDGVDYEHNFPLSYSASVSLTEAMLDSVRRPTRVAMLIHESRKTINDGLYLWKGNDWDRPDEVHYDGTTISYSDGHVRWGRSSALEKECRAGYWDPTVSTP